MSAQDGMICLFLAAAGFTLLRLLATVREAAWLQVRAEARAKAEAERQRRRRLELQEAEEIARNSDVQLV